jgi:hypothetical protein
MGRKCEIRCDNLGLRDKTAIVFVSDHGFYARVDANVQCGARPF